MTVKEYLSQAYRINEMIRANVDTLEHLSLLLENVANFDVVDRINDLKAEINEETNRYVNLVSKIRSQISAVLDPDEKLILQKRYLLFQTWQEIAEDMDYSIQWIRKLHKRALHSFSAANDFR